ncbi:MAG TPA: F0F1 ATP synthase subunit A [Chthonomonadales bacterium]|nr:F0F1 ATP synthase subunit A [Chthonomonadales bacterium]
MPERSGQIQLARAGGNGHSGEAHAAAGAHTAQEHGGKHSKRVGDVPDPSLLFANACVTASLLVIFAIAATRKLQRIPRARSLQNLAEFIVEALVRFTRGIIGPGGERHLPLVGTLFLFIYLNNVIGLVPGFHSPSANLSINLALGLTVFLYVQYVGIRNRGIRGYVKHYCGPMPALAPLILPVELVSELVRPFTLAMRLFGVIFGEETVIIVLAILGVAFIPIAPVVPVQFPVLVLCLLTTFVQALVFSVLTCIYISLQSPHGDDDEGEHKSEEGQAVAAAH